MDLRRLPEMLRAAPWRTPPELAVQAALGPSMELAVLLRERCVGPPASFCTVKYLVSVAAAEAAICQSLCLKRSLNIQCDKDLQTSLHLPLEAFR